MKLFLSLLCFLNFFTLNGHAVELKIHRESFGIYNQRHVYESQARQRVEKLHALLGTYPLIHPEHFEISRNKNTHNTNSTLFFWSTLQNIVSDLHSDAVYGKPLVFNPADYLFEIDENAWQKRFQLCKKDIGGKLDEYIKTFATLVYKAEKEASQQNIFALEDGKTALVLADKLEQTIFEYDKKLTPGKGLKFSEILGHIVQVNTVDGIVEKIKFTQSGNYGKGYAQKISDGDSINLSLGMLARLRSGYERSFLETQKCFLELVTQKIKVMKEKDQDLTEIGKVEAFLQKKFQGSKHANSILSKLSEDQVDYLLGIFLSLRGVDIPVDGESDDFSAYVIHKKPEHTQDFLFYKTLNSDLALLEETLVQDKYQQEQLNRIRKNIGDSK